jgi:atypical dual specificity phosphatase
MAHLPGLHRLPRQLWTYITLKRVTWLDGDVVAACRYPKNATNLEDLRNQGVRVLINLHQRPHGEDLLQRYGMRQVHLPVADFTAPTQAQLGQGVAEIAQTVAMGDRVAVHCGAGLGRTGTLLACYLVSRGLGAGDAIARIRALRPGSVETPQQEAAVLEFERALKRDQSTD